jgi:N-acetylglutamate synthase-like GNAT family acetyltransferase
MDIRLAHPEETDRVAALVAAAGLPTAGLAGAWRTWVAVDSDRLLGTASLERHGGAYLLRSVAVRDQARGRGIGAQLVRVALAAVDPARPVALLTETAPGWFPSSASILWTGRRWTRRWLPRPSWPAPARPAPRRSCARPASPPYED